MLAVGIGVSDPYLEEVICQSSAAVENKQRKTKHASCHISCLGYPWHWQINQKLPNVTTYAGIIFG